MRLRSATAQGHSTSTLRSATFVEVAADQRKVPNAINKAWYLHRPNNNNKKQNKETGTSAACAGTARSHSSPAPGPRAGPGAQRGRVGRSDTNSTARAEWPHVFSGGGGFMSRRLSRAIYPLRFQILELVSDERGFPIARRRVQCWFAESHRDQSEKSTEVDALPSETLWMLFFFLTLLTCWWLQIERTDSPLYVFKTSSLQFLIRKVRQHKLRTRILKLCPTFPTKNGSGQKSMRHRELRNFERTRLEEAQRVRSTNRNTVKPLAERRASRCWLKVLVSFVSF